jgi:hypothetical protein
MTDALRKELPRMLEEHPRIHAAVAKLGIVAREEHASEHADLADDLTAHARSEEEVLYPATILVGDLIRVWMAGKPRQICGARSAALRDATLAHIVEPLNVPPQWRFILERSDETRARPYDPWTSAQRRRDL